MKPRKAIKRESAKHAAKRVEAEQVRRAYLRTHPFCEIGAVLDSAGEPAAAACDKRSLDIHERQKRSRLGSLTDDNNLLATCRPCHDFTEQYPARATELGLLVPSWGSA